MTHFDPKTLKEKDRQQFQAALEGLSPAQHSTLLTALTRMEQPVVRAWLKEDILREWGPTGPAPECNAGRAWGNAGLGHVRGNA